MYLVAYYAHKNILLSHSYLCIYKLVLIETLFFFLQKIDISVFETNIRFIGGFLTCYAMTGDTIFRDKADYIAKKLLPAFQTPTGIPYSLVNLKTGVSIIFKFV